ncbi:MAG TPA: tRNA1(Val) (adenine(37)-N6)-methyltransferase [Syntrophales bacterium]|nr:tRNA1(Val) (adenine(37)-N6)-methyltransferase [Syntrophales bacterium]
MALPETGPEIREGEVLDVLLDGRLKVLQKKRGYRFSVDALLLAHFVRLRRGDRLADLGTGCGVLPLLLAGRRPGVRAVGVELQAELADLARRNVVLNDLAGRIEIVPGDVRNIGFLLPRGSFDAVVSNPPYRRVRSGRINPDGEKAAARHEIRGTIEDFVRAARFLLKPDGRAFFIYAAVRSVEILARMRAAGIEPKRLRLVHDDRDVPGAFALIEGRRGGGEGLKVEPPLFLREGGGYTEETKRLFAELAPAIP